MPRTSVPTFDMATSWLPITSIFIMKPMYKARNPRRNEPALPEYLISMNSASFKTLLRRHSLAKRNVVNIPPKRKTHHSQFLLIPNSRVQPATYKGVSSANVVATIDVPSSHQLSRCPERKYPRISSPESFLVKIPTMIAKAK